MTASEYLGQARKLDKEIDALLTLKDGLISRLYSISPQMGERVQGTPHNKLEDGVIKLVDLEAYIDKKIDKLADAKQDIVVTIEKVSDPTYRTVLTNRYLNYLSIEQTAERMNYHERWMWVLTKRALKEVEKIINN